MFLTPIAISTLIPLAIAFAASAILSRELAIRKGRDEYFYLIVGLLIGPLALMIVLTPTPEEATALKKKGKKPLRYVEGKRCPYCRHELGVRATRCPHCREAVDSPWWDRPVSWLRT